MSPAVDREGLAKRALRGKRRSLLQSLQTSGTGNRAPFRAPGPLYSGLHFAGLSRFVPPTHHSGARKGPPAEALPAGQTLRPGEHKGWVNSSLAFSSGSTLHGEAETNAGRIPGLCLGAINRDQQGTQCTQLRRMTCRNVASNNKEELNNNARNEKCHVSDWSRSEMSERKICETCSPFLLPRTMIYTRSLNTHYHTHRSDLAAKTDFGTSLQPGPQIQQVCLHHPSL